MRPRLVSAALVCLALVAQKAAAQGVPAAIGPDAVKQTKQATLYLKVTGASGEVGEGSGFLAIEPGIVITNAHVVGMRNATSKAPKKIEIVVNSGERDEKSLTGKLLGVDIVNDLAVLQVEGKLPAPLQLGLKDELFETQKVYIFGFPFGAKLGKNITVSESSISSLRKDGSGALERIQVNGGMHPGNSGGPVVNALGQVVGVSVAGIRATHINFAIPARSVKTLLDGGIQEAKAGELFRDKDQVRVPLEYRTLDPFGRIKEVRVETWTGEPATDRPFSTEKALEQKGDGPRKTHVLKPVAALASGEVVLPVPPKGQVAWVQPVLVFAKGESVWGQPVAHDPAQALERIPAELKVKLDAGQQRTVHLKTSQLMAITEDKFRLVVAESAELQMLESFSPEAPGTRVRLTFGVPTLTFEDDGKKIPVSAEVMAHLQRVPPSFVVDGANKLRTRTDFNLNPKLPLLVREQVKDFLSQISNGYEASTFIMPGRPLKPRDVWNVQNPILVKLGDKGEVLDLALACTYEGTRGKGDVPEAVVSFTGKAQGRGAMKGKIAGDISGRFTFNLAKGFISSTQMTIASESTSAVSDLQVGFSFNIDLSRVEGNPLKLEAPKVAGTPTGVILSRNGALTPKDPLDTAFGGRGSRMHVVPVNLEGGQKCSVLLESADFDTYLRLLDPSGKLVAEDDDGGGALNSRIDHVPAKTGQYKIIVTSFDGKAGAYQLQVFGDKGKVIAKGDPMGDPGKTKLDVPVKDFTKPALSKEPTSYLKIKSSPGDFIGQGKGYAYGADQLMLKETPRGISLRADGWTLEVGAPNGQTLQIGEFSGAKRFAFSGDSPGLDFFGMGRGSNRVAGAFVVWELETTGGRITRLAIDFVQHSEEKGPPLFGRLRFNSSFE